MDSGSLVPSRGRRLARPARGGRLVLDRSFPIGAEAAREAGSHHIFGVFETNGWHSLGALVLGVLAASILIAAPERARRVARLIGVINVGLALSLVAWDPSTFWIHRTESIRSFTLQRAWAG